MSGNLLPGNSAAASDEPPTERCQTKIQRYDYKANGVTEVRWSQQITWCYNQTSITYWKFATNYQVFSRKWVYRGPYTPIVTERPTKTIIQTSALFKRETGSVIYWQPYIKQIVTPLGNYRCLRWSRSW